MYARHITASWVFSMMFWEGDFSSTLASVRFRFSCSICHGLSKYIEILAGLTGWIGFNVLSRYKGSFVDYIVIQRVRSQSSDRLCPTNVNTYLFTYVVYANRNRIVALASIEPAGEIKTWNSCHACPAFSEFHPPHSMPMPRPFIGNTTQQSCQRLKLGSIQHACRAVGGWNSRIIAPLLLGGFITIKVTRCLENTHVWGPYDTIFSVVMFWVCAGSPVAAVFESIRISSLTSTVSSFQCFTRRSSVLESAPDCLEKNGQWL